MAYEIRDNQRLWHMKEFFEMSKIGLFENERVELIEGRVLVKSPDSHIHRLTITKITRYLVRVLPERFYLQPQSSFPIDNYSVPEPDIAIMEGDIEADLDVDFRGASLIIEVSLSSLRYDRTTKMELYAKSDIPEYWIVNLPQVALEVYRSPDTDEGRYTESQTLKIGDDVTTPFDDLVVPVAELLFNRKP